MKRTNIYVNRQKKDAIPTHSGMDGELKGLNVVSLPMRADNIQITAINRTILWGDKRRMKAQNVNQNESSIKKFRRTAGVYSIGTEATRNADFSSLNCAPGASQI